MSRLRSQAYEARDEAQSKISALKEKHDKEVAQYNMEVKELTRVLEHDRKLRYFMGAKGQDRLKVLVYRLSLSSLPFLLSHQASLVSLCQSIFSHVNSQMLTCVGA
jgi:hypothetical protein